MIGLGEPESSPYMPQTGVENRRPLLSTDVLLGELGRTFASWSYGGDSFITISMPLHLWSNPFLKGLIAGSPSDSNATRMCPCNSASICTSINAWSSTPC